MNIQKTILVITCIATLLACNSKDKKTITPSSTETETENTSQVIEPSKAELILNQSIEAHGGDLYDTAQYAFVFRGNNYQFINDGKNYEYSKTSKKGNVITKDVLKNGKFSRTVNGEPVEPTEKAIKGGTGAINSVIYFATLPHKLNDASVNKTYVGETTIKGEKYTVLGVTFKQEGGGEDFDDEYHYWIHTETHQVDYLAYNYKVNNGGVRFRSAYNKRVVDGVTFQDYINYEAELNTALKDLPALYEAGNLKELSKIDTEDVVNLKNK
ncbi:DUF6503 family protein [Mariniflexile sp. AS56]|uniref:DUF6503 family protein n=1 Tax=Mariniflexile sp. AS56 TaxID=3063957 RepID=UPI0026ED0258|nr:DUF6503 family protein [Mariniflexile sp. AS56]MDO7173521.1 hypothetical protein [Mariniflexile sp. AS56]